MKEVLEMANHTWLYEMSPFVPERLGDWVVTRVPGGWIFESKYQDVGGSPLFIPFNNDLQNVKPAVRE